MGGYSFWNIIAIIILIIGTIFAIIGLFSGTTGQGGLAGLFNQDRANMYRVATWMYLLAIAIFLGVQAGAFGTIAERFEYDQ